MTIPPRPPQAAGGIFLAIGTLAGAVAGLLHGQPTIGLLGGFAAGLVANLLLWLAQRRR
jgi:energy-converting hydrogenase Eha subunit B